MSGGAFPGDASVLRAPAAPLTSVAFRSSVAWGFLPPIESASKGFVFVLGEFLISHEAENLYATTPREMVCQAEQSTDW